MLMPVLLLAMPLFAQQPAPVTPQAAPAAATAASKTVAVVNGEVISVDKLDRLYSNLGAQMRRQYDTNGGKGAFLENYIRKRLLIQEALKSGYDKQPDVAAALDSARESALFDHYVRDVVAAPIVSEDEVKTYYSEHADDFATPEKVHVRHIVVAVTNVGPAPKSKERALEIIQQVASEIRAADVASAQAKSDSATLARLRLAHFSDAAKRYSEDASRESGGDLGWIVKGQTDPEFENAAWNMKVGTVSGVVQTKFGYHLIMVEGREPAGTEPYDAVKAGVREFLVTQKAVDVVSAVQKLTNELRGSSRISVFPENIK
jgi:peptidyl-prolyl cis-trans isomerase C